MKKISILILLIIGLIKQTSAQEQLTKMQVADDFFDRYDYAKSLNIYKDLAERNHPSIHAIERIADCYRFLYDYDNAELWYQKAISYPNANVMDAYYYAEVLLRNQKLKEAREQYKQYYGNAGNADELKFKLAMCDSAEAWAKLTSRFTIKNEQKYNSKNSDWGTNFLGKTGFVFTSDRKIPDKKNNTYDRTGDGYFKVYHTDGDIVIPFELKPKINSIFDGDYNIGPMAFNAAEDTAYITVTANVPKHILPTDKITKGSKQLLYTRRLQIIIATKTNGKWVNFKSFPYNNVKRYSIGNATLSKDGNVMYFTSDMPGGEGKTDIWYCVKQKGGGWDTPVNCGKTINTKEDESFPNIGGDSALYFSSNGLPGMGGLDIFKSKGEKASWSKPENLKYPLNSTSDDFYYITKDSLSGYFSSNREGGQGSDDIYSFSYQPVVKAVMAVAPPKTEKTEKVAQPIVTEKIVQPPLKKGDTFVLKNIYYDLNKSDIRPDAAAELDKLVVILKEHPTMRLEISSHTDSRAPAYYNLALSNRRAAAAVAYLVKQGIARNRLVPKGYGDTKLLNQCAKGVLCSEAEHQLNRRTEVKVLSE